MNSRSYLFLSILSFFPLIAVIPSCELAQNIVTAQKQPTEVIQRIAALTGIEGQLDVKKLIEMTQKPAALWLRPPATERDSIKPVFIDKNKELLELFSQLGMCGAIIPKGKSFKYGLVLGATARTMLTRLTFLENLCKNGSVKLEKLLLLTGKRLLNVADPKEAEFLGTYFKDLSAIKTETDIAKALLLNTDLFPVLKKIPLAYTDSEADKGDSRPRTGNTVIDWIATKPEAGSCLAVSSNPFIAYQDTTLRTTLPADFTLETCGPTDPRLHGDLAVGFCLDSLARWLYQYDKWATEVAKLSVPVTVKELSKP